MHAHLIGGRRQGGHARPTMRVVLGIGGGALVGSLLTLLWAARIGGASHAQSRTRLAGQDSMDLAGAGGPPLERPRAWPVMRAGGRTRDAWSDGQHW